MFYKLLSYKNLDGSPVGLKQTLLIDFIAITSMFALLYAAVSFMIDYSVGIVAMLISFVVFGISLMLYVKHKISYFIAANSYIGNACFIAVTICTFFSGGDLSPVLPWFLLIPVISLLLLGMCRATYIWLSITLIAILTFFIAGIVGFNFPVNYDYTLFKYFNLICVFGLALIVFIITSIFESEKEKAFVLINEKNKEITDSINYAKRLQDAILPSLEDVSRNFIKSFVYYKPKDIVAGDFYWMEENKDLIYFAVADCTGHGVPGAMVSMVCSNALTKSLVEEQIDSPAGILDRSRELIAARFGKSDQEIKDGMDISLFSYNPVSHELICTGAHNPVWIIRNSDNRVEEIKADKQPVAFFIDKKPFTETIVNLEKGDRVYLFTDGFVDQFGGDRGKKFLKAKFRRLLVAYAEIPMEKQKAAVDSELVKWMGDIEQVDDICIFGFEV